VFDCLCSCWLGCIPAVRRYRLVRCESRTTPRVGTTYVKEWGECHCLCVYAADDDVGGRIYALDEHCGWVYSWVATSYVYCAMRLVELSVCVHVWFVGVLSLCAPGYMYVANTASKHDKARDEYL
jgi:hypothetical protein